MPATAGPSYGGSQSGIHSQDGGKATGKHGFPIETFGNDGKGGHMNKNTWSKLALLITFLGFGMVTAGAEEAGTNVQSLINKEQGQRIKALEEKLEQLLKSGGKGSVAQPGPDTRETKELQQEIEALKKRDALMENTMEALMQEVAAQKKAPTGNVNVGYGTLTLKGLIQFQFDAGEEGNPNTTFLIKRARIILSGQTPVKQVSYFIQADMTQTPALLDAKINLAYIPKTNISAGRYIPGFTYYGSRGAGDLDFINYPLMLTYGSNKYFPWRQYGVQSETKYKYLNFNLGAFNGFPANSTTADDNSQKDYLGALNITPLKGMAFYGYRWQGKEKVGSRTDYAKVRTGGGFSFKGKRLMFVSEYMNTVDESSVNQFGQSAFGNVGYKVVPWFELIGRYEFVDPNRKLPNNSEVWTTYGFNILQDGNNIKYSVNYIVKQENPKINNDEILAQMQIQF